MKWHYVPFCQSWSQAVNPKFEVKWSRMVVLEIWCQLNANVVMESDFSLMKFEFRSIPRTFSL